MLKTYLHRRGQIPTAIHPLEKAATIVLLQHNHVIPKGLEPASRCQPCNSSTHHNPITLLVLDISQLNPQPLAPTPLILLQRPDTTTAGIDGRSSASTKHG